jgi:hypothetical protein
MSAFGGEADVSQERRDVRLYPTADIKRGLIGRSSLGFYFQATLLLVPFKSDCRGFFEDERLQFLCSAGTDAEPTA